MNVRLIFGALFIFSGLYGQEKNASYSSFSIDNKEVIWAQVYHASHPAGTLMTQVREFLNRKAWIKNIQWDEGEILAEIQNFRVDYKRYGGKFMNTSNIIRTARWSGKARISFKDGKYRVIVYGLEYDARQPAMQAGKVSNESHMIHGSWTDWVLNNYRSHFKKKRHINMDIMHFNLKDAFTLKETEFVDEQW